MTNDNPSKRTRRIVGNGGAVPSDEDDDVSVKLAKDMLEANLSDSDGENESDDEHMDDIAPTGRSVVAQAIPRDIGECGKLRKIEVWDFMCHRRLEVTFSSGMTCITGSNGSGKSAIVAALQVCLGMSASETGRADKLAALIRNGASGGAKIHVHLANEGPRAYFPDEFSDEIIVERTILQTGSTQSKILNGRTKKVMRTKKKDVEDLADSLGLHVDNPCCVLDQETAKLFLKGSAKDKYKFFLRATDLGSILREFAAEKEEKNRAVEEYAHNLKVEKELEVKFKAAEKEYQALDVLRGLSEEVKRLETMIFWASVRDAKLDQEDLVKIAEKSAKDLEEASNKAKAAQKRFEDQEVYLQSVRGNLDKLGNDQQRLAEELGQAKKMLKDKQGPIKRAERDLNQKVAELKSYRDEKTSYEDQIQTLLRRASGSQDSHRMEEQLKTKQERLALIDAELAAMTSQDSASEKEDMQHQLSEAKRAKSTAGAQVESQRRAIADLEQRLAVESQSSTTTRSSRFSDLARFFIWMPALMEKVANSTEFVNRPIFVGQHVRLTRPEYQMAVEPLIGSSLLGFIAGSADDEKRLRFLAESCGARASDVTVFIRTISQQRIDVSRGKPNDFLTVMDVLEIDEPNVFITLVDQHRIESTVLLKDVSEDHRVWLGSATSARMPDRVSSAITMQGEVLSVRGGSRVFENNARNPNSLRLLSRESATDAVKAKVDDLKRQLESSKTALVQTEHEVSVHSKNVALLESKLRDLQKAETTFTDRARQLTTEKKSLNKAVDELHEKLQDLASGKDAISLQNLRDEIKRVDDDMALTELSIREIKGTISAAEQELRPWQQKIEEIQALHAEKAKEIKRYDEELENFSSKAVAAELDKAKREEHQLQAKFNAAQASVEEMAAKVKQLEQLALSHSSPMEITEQTSALKKRFREQNAVMEDERKRNVANNETADERLIRARSELERCKKSYENVRADRKSVSKRIRLLKKMMKNRRKRFLDFRRHAETSTRDIFRELLHYKGHDGNVTFDHDNNEIKISWVKRWAGNGTSTQMTQDDLEDENEENQEKTFTDAKSLSGGERSITTLALLLAMGHSVQSPFRVMDEFDVFMDAGARKIALQQLVEDAKTTKNGMRKQYILLSPTGFTTLPSDPDLNILKRVVTPDTSSFGKGGSRQTQTTIDEFVGNSN